MRGYELITSNVLMDATDKGGEETEQCDCSKPASGSSCCYDERCYNFATQTECIDCWPGIAQLHLCCSAYVANLMQLLCASVEMYIQCTLFIVAYVATIDQHLNPNQSEK